MAEATQSTEEISQTLNKTDFGHMIYENRKILFGILIATLLGVTGYLIWKQTQESAAVTTSEEVFKFQSTTWTEAKAGKTAPADLVKSFNGLSQDVQQAPVMMPIVLEMGQFLHDKGALAEADSILAKASETNHVLGQFFVGMQRIVVLEKLGKTDEAISVLEKMSSTKDIPMPQKVALELGRLYLLKGEKGKAQTQFQNVVSQYPNDEYAKIAKLYLGQLAQ